MPVTNYNTYNGRIRSETTAGVITSYLTDALGSVTATVNKSQVIENTYRYKPYGATLAKTGISPDPGFLWTGDTGSRPTGLVQSGQYNRARHYNGATANWTTIDPLWPDESSFGYANGNPTTLTDGLGLQAEPCPLPEPPPQLELLEGGGRCFLGELGVIGLGAYACSDLYTYCTTGKTGLLTGIGAKIGDCVGNMLYPTPPSGPVKRYKKKPITRFRQNPGRKPNGDCKPCPPDETRVETHPKFYKVLGCCCRGGHEHTETWNQVPSTCECFPHDTLGACTGTCLPLHEGEEC